MVFGRDFTGAVSHASLSIAALAASKAEGQSGSTALTFTVTRSGDTSIAHSTKYAVAGSGAAPAGAADFAGGVLPSGTVSFAAGQTSQTVTVNVAGDTAVEADEGFTVTLASPSSGAVIGTATAAGAIQNDDVTTVSIVATDATKPEGKAGTTSTFTFTVIRSDTSLGGMSLPYAVTPGALRPANGADIVGGALPIGTVDFGPGDTKATISVAFVGDDITEPNENFVVTLNSPPIGVVFGIASANGTILADEPIGDLAPVMGADGKTVPATPTYYAGPVGGVEKELILLTSENLAIAVAGANWFIRSDSGDDAIAVAGGTNVLDGGTGSNFLTGASGFDTFFVDARGATLPIWSTVNDFGKGDAATLWGVAESTHTLTWLDNQGAEGFKGLTLHASAPGRPTASLTLPGYDLANKAGALTVLFGFEPVSGSNYMYVLAN